MDSQKKKQPVLRAFQSEAINATYALLAKREKKTLLEMAAGTGKTIVVAELVRLLIKDNMFHHVLIISSTMASLEHFRCCFLDNGISAVIGIKNTNNESVVLLTYAALRRVDSINQFDLIICDDAYNTKNEKVRSLFQKTQSSFVGFMSSQEECDTNWFSDVKPAFKYTIDDGIREGYYSPLANPREYSIAIEGFCSRLFQSFNYRVEQEKPLGNTKYTPDIIIHFDKYIAVIEAKAYRDRYVSKRTIDTAINQLQKYKAVAQDNQLSVDDFFLILFCEIDEQYKRQVYNDYRINIWDIANLLYICKESNEFSEELNKLVYYPISDIAPLEPITSITQSAALPQGNVNVIESTECEDFERRLRSCKKGKNASLEYEQICTEIIQYLFDGEFTQISDQHKTSDDLFRMDLLCGIKGTTAFWELLIRHYNTRFVVFEFKNYTKQLAQNLIYITEKYLFNAALRNVAIIVSRKGFSRNAGVASLGCLKEDGKLIIDLTDDDLISMLYKKQDGEEPSDFLLWKIECLLMSVSK